MSDKKTQRTLSATGGILKKKAQTPKPKTPEESFSAAAPRSIIHMGTRSSPRHLPRVVAAAGQPWDSDPSHPSEFSSTHDEPEVGVYSLPRADAVQRKFGSKRGFLRIDLSGAQFPEQYDDPRYLHKIYREVDRHVPGIRSGAHTKVCINCREGKHRSQLAADYLIRKALPGHFRHQHNLSLDRILGPTAQLNKWPWRAEHLKVVGEGGGAH